MRQLKKFTNGSGWGALGLQTAYITGGDTGLDLHSLHITDAGETVVVDDITQIKMYLGEELIYGPFSFAQIDAVNQWEGYAAWNDTADSFNFHFEDKHSKNPAQMILTSIHIAPGQTLRIEFTTANHTPATYEFYGCVGEYTPGPVTHFHEFVSPTQATGETAFNNLPCEGRYSAWLKVFEKVSAGTLLSTRITVGQDNRELHNCDSITNAYRNADNGRVTGSYFSDVIDFTLYGVTDPLLFSGFKNGDVSMRLNNATASANTFLLMTQG